MMQTAEAQERVAPRVIGRPTSYDSNIAMEICDALAQTPRGLDFLCSTNPHWPSSRTIWYWLAKHEAFLQSYERAREQQATLLFEEALEIADDSSRDTRLVGPADDLREAPDTEWIARSKLRVETRMRMAGKLHPKKYGDHKQVTVEANVQVHQTATLDASALDPAKRLALREILLLASAQSDPDTIEGTATEPGADLA